MLCNRLLSFNNGLKHTMVSLPRFLNLHMRLSTKFSVGIVCLKLSLEIRGEINLQIIPTEILNETKSKK